MSVVSLAVTNRLRVVRKVTDNNQLMADVMLRNQNVENSLQQIINESDELARYYVSRRYYVRNDTLYSQTGSIERLDSYLSGLITTNFQMQVKSEMSTSTITSTDCVKVVFVYLVIRRISNPSLVPALKSIPEMIDGNQDAILSVISKTMTVKNGISESTPTFIQILDTVKLNKPFLEIKMHLSYDTSALHINTTSVDSSLEYFVYTFPYASSGIDIIKPGDEDLKKILENKVNKISNIE